MDSYPGYDIRPSDGVAPALKLWWVWSALSLSLLPGSPGPRVVAPDGALSMGQIEQTASKQMTDDELCMYVI